MTAPTPLTPENAIRTLKQLVCGASPWGATGPLMMCLIDCKASTLLELVEQIEIAFTAETQRADVAEARAEFMCISSIERIDAAKDAKLAEAERQRDEAESYGKEVFATVETVLLRAQEAERQRDDLAARVVILTEHLQGAWVRSKPRSFGRVYGCRWCAAPFVDSPNAEIKHTDDCPLHNLPAAAVALRERLEKAEKDAAVNIRLRKSLGPALEAKTQECVILQRRITALEATARTPGTVTLNDILAVTTADYPGCDTMSVETNRAMAILDFLREKGVDA